MVTLRYFIVGLRDGSVRVVFPDASGTIRLTRIEPA
jgi:hypothetical protein